MINSSPQVAVVGGGFSGIAAAKKLFESGISFKILEARDRVGGRTHTKTISENLYVDLGGQWIGPTQDRMYELCEEHGVAYFETYDQGKNVLDLKGKIRTYSGVIPKMDPISLINLDWLIKKIEKLANQIDLISPWTHPKARQFDAVTLEYYLRKHTKTDACYQVIKVGCKTIFATELNEVSLLHALFYIKSGTSLDCLINIKNGVKQHRMKGGMQGLAKKIATPFMEHIQFNSAVRRIDYSGEGVTVKGDDFEINASKVIIAVPPPLLAQLIFSPLLPIAKRQLLDRYPMGHVGKCFMIYEKPFWRKNNFFGQVVSDQNTPFQTMFDCSPADGSAEIMMAFTIGERAKAFFQQDKSTRKFAMQNLLISYFGEESNQSTQYLDFSMSDEIWSKGCYAGVMPTGAWTGFEDAYRKSIDPIYFAGTEASTRWNGYIEGAVLAGEAAAAQIILRVNND
jgi:monoamine oxidase